MNAPADIGQAVAYSHMLAGTGLAMDAAHLEFERRLTQPVDIPEPTRVMTTEDKRAALTAKMRANGQTAAAAAMAGVL